MAVNLRYRFIVLLNKSSQFSHKQLVLVATPVSTGVYFFIYLPVLKKYPATQPTSASVYLVAKNMPKPASDKQYQLWALITGQDGQLQPTSLGLFDVGSDGKIILKMENAQKADAFAITMEKRGNTGGPTLEELQTMGKTSL